MMDNQNKHAPIFTDTFTLCEWLLARLDQNSSMLAREICRQSLELLDAVVLAIKDRYRDERIEEADEHLIALRLKLRLANCIALLNEEQLLFVLEQADRIGRQLGGWRRSLDRA